jgi:hypothetical protein
MGAWVGEDGGTCERGIKFVKWRVMQDTDDAKFWQCSCGCEVTMWAQCSVDEWIDG